MEDEQTQRLALELIRMADRLLELVKALPPSYFTTRSDLSIEAGRLQGIALTIRPRA